MAEKTVRVKFNTTTSYTLSPREDLDWNLGEHNYPKRSIKMLNVECGEIRDIPESLYNQIKDKTCRLPNGKMGDLKEAMKNLQGFKAMDLTQNVCDELLICEKI